MLMRINQWMCRPGRSWSGPGRLSALAPVIVACIVLLGQGCSPERTEEKAEKVVNVKVSKVSRETVRPSIEAVGSLEPDREVIVSSEVDGILRELLVKEGEAVDEGALLARISDIDYRLGVQAAEAALGQARATLVNARAVHDRMEALHREQAISQQEYDNALTRLDVAGQDLDRATAALSLARERLGKTVIRAPMAGAVKQRYATAGDFVGAGRPVMRIISTDPVKLAFSVAERHVGQLEKGQEVVFTVDPYPEREFGGTLQIIYPNLDDKTRMLRVEAVVPNRSGELRPGLFARVKLYIGPPRQAVVIPITSILYEGTKTRVFVAEGDVARERTVTLGRKYDEMMEVLEGIQDKESLVVVGQNALADGVRIRVAGAGS